MRAFRCCGRRPVAAGNAVVRYPGLVLVQVQEMAARSSLVFVQQVDVYGRTWSMTMIGMETEWVQTVSPWMLFGMMLLATVIVTLLMISVVRQHNVMASLQRKDIARLKVTLARPCLLSPAGALVSVPSHLPI